MSDLPDAIRALLARIDTDSGSQMERNILHALRQALSSIPDFDLESCMEVKAELMALEFFPDYQGAGFSWGTYYGPLFAFQGEGETEGRPSIRSVTDTVIRYWEMRATETMNLTLRNRYSDLVWDFSPKVLKRSAEMENAQRTIDTAVEISVTAQAAGILPARRRLARALTIALSVGDRARVSRVAKALILLESRTAELGKQGTWGYSYELLVENKKVKLPDEEKAAVIEQLETRLTFAAEVSGEEGMPRDPYAVERAALMLARYYRRNDRKADLTRVLQILTKSSLMFARRVTATMALNFLKRTLEVLDRYGLHSEANQISIAFREIGPRLKQEMKTISHEIVITDEQVREFRDKLLRGNAEEAARRIVYEFIPRLASINREIEDAFAAAPLSFLIPHSIHDAAGRTIAEVGPLSEDPDGRRVLHVSQSLELQFPWLHFALTGWVDRYKITADSVLQIMLQSPLFQESRKPLYRLALDAYLKGEQAVAAHLIIPQIEHAVRRILELQGASTYRLGRHKGLNLRTLDDCLASEDFSRFAGDDAQAYLRILLTDQRGYNLRNNYCHGTIDVPCEQPIHTHWLIHVLLYLSLARSLEPASPAVDSAPL